MTDNFEEEYGYSPDSEYEVVKTNDPDDKKWEQMKEEFMKDDLKRVRSKMRGGNNAQRM